MMRFLGLHNESDAYEPEPFDEELGKVYSTLTRTGQYEEARVQLKQIISRLEQEKSRMRGDYGIVNYKIRKANLAIWSINRYEYQEKKAKLRQAAIIIIGLKKRGNVQVPKRVKFWQYIGINVNTTRYTKIPKLAEVDTNFIKWFAQTIYNYPIQIPEEPNMD
jgi:hypothetical protein